MAKVDLKVQPFNATCKCFNCEKGFNLSQKDLVIHVVNTIASITPDNAGGMQVAMVLVPICDPCFKELGLLEQPDPADRIILPGKPSIQAR